MIARKFNNFVTLFMSGLKIGDYVLIQGLLKRRSKMKKEQDRNDSFHVPLLQGLIRQKLENTFAHRSDLLKS
ncbi:hypothetical protein ACTFH1_07360 [Staphylococcus auricularis]|uniref:Uncharacterized protein n=1 Tax=Staphylococcus auricularis TaxID=29379 RepID=A0ABX5IE72_9STAP|nr:hypothetical protein BU607_09070 [Staphylococcus auricularis]